jgi:hypothetical protein
MATISSNKLGLYAFNTTQTSPLEVMDTSTAIASITDTSVAALGVATEAHFIVENSGEFVGIAKRSASSGAPSDETGNLALMALATSTSLEAQNAITETAARNGSGGSTNFIVSGAMTWSTNIEGLLDVASAAGSAVTIMDAARSKQYLVAKFEVAEAGTAKTFYAGQTLIDSVSLSGGVDDIATYSATLSGYGDLFKGTES